jgi:peptide deformylase
MLTVIDFSPGHNQPLCLINPTITQQEGSQIDIEGCMSIGNDFGIYEKVTRYAKITVNAFDRNGEPLHFEAEDFLSRCIQHELDHLKGKIFLDHLSLLKRQRIEQKLKNALRRQAA